MKKDVANNLNNILEEIEKAESTLLIQRNKNLGKNLRKYFKYQQQLAKFQRD